VSTTGPSEIAAVTRGMPRSMKAAISTTMNSRTFSRKYIAKLAFKVEHQALQEADRTKLEERISFTRKNYRMMRERLLKIIYWK
jgi:hypothetical protein